MYNKMTKQRLKLLRKELERNTDGIQYHHYLVDEMKYVNHKAFPSLKYRYEYMQFRGLLLLNKPIAELQRLLFIDILIESFT